MLASNTGATTARGDSDVVLYAVVELTNDRPTGAVLVFPTADAADTWARRERLDGYIVVPTRFVALQVPLPR